MKVDGSDISKYGVIVPNNKNNRKLIANFEYNFTAYGLKVFLKKIELNLSLLTKIISCIMKFS
jgi:hypothetical protein